MIPSGCRSAALLRLVLLAYVVALAAMPFAHHDLACHLKSNTHCAMCHVGTSTDPEGGQPSLGAADLADAGCPDQRTSCLTPLCTLSPSAGRAPPASSIVLL